jgi:hypothetical protein
VVTRLEKAAAVAGLVKIGFEIWTMIHDRVVERVAALEAKP